MPGIYRANRNGLIGRAGLALPFTPTTGPIRFAQNYLDFEYVRMHDHYIGYAQDAGGIWTDEISDCAVFAAAEWTGNSWGACYFAHVQGGQWGVGIGGGEVAIETLDALKRYADNVDLRWCFSVLLVTSGGTLDRQFAALPGELGFPPERLSVYVSNTHVGLGFALEFRTMGEFGELLGPAPGNPLKGSGFGVTSHLATFDSYEW